MLPGSFPIPWPLTEVLLKAAPQQDLNLWPVKHEATPLPNLLQNLLSHWVELNWPELASGQDPREKSYFSFEAGGSLLVLLMSVFPRNGLDEQGAINWVEIEPGSLGYYLWLFKALLMTLWVRAYFCKKC